MQEAILSGNYRGQGYTNVKVKVIGPPKHGAKGWFVQVDGRGYEDVPQQVFRMNITEAMAGHLRSTELGWREPEVHVGLTETGIKVTTETDDEVTKRIANRFEILRKMAEGSIHGTPRSMIVSGAPGVGKSYTIESTMSYAEEEGLVKYFTVKGTISAIDLYKLMYEHRDENSVIVLDDCDAILFDETALNILKSALDTTSSRRICWLKESRALEDTPTSFSFNGTIIFITNLDFQKIIDSGRNKLIPHLAALLSRSLYLDLTLHGKRDLVCWITHMVLENNILKDKGLTRDQYLEVLDFLKDNIDRLRSISLRTALQAADLVKMDPAHWRETAKVVMLR